MAAIKTEVAEQMKAHDSNNSDASARNTGSQGNAIWHPTSFTLKVGDFDRAMAGDGVKKFDAELLMKSCSAHMPESKISWGGWGPIRKNQQVYKVECRDATPGVSLHSKTAQILMDAFSDWL